MFIRKDVKPFEKKVWLASPTMHGDELKWMSDAYNKNLLIIDASTYSVEASELPIDIGCFEN